MTRLTHGSNFNKAMRAAKMFSTTSIPAEDDERRAERRLEWLSKFGMAFMGALTLIGFIMLVATPNEMWGW